MKAHVAESTEVQAACRRGTEPVGAFTVSKYTNSLRLLHRRKKYYGMGSCDRSGRGMSYPANYVQEHINALEPCHEPSCIIIYFSSFTVYFSQVRKEVGEDVDCCHTETTKSEMLVVEIAGAEEKWPFYGMYYS
ncbi:hypothetical protein TNCV_4577111 [Trichonephila clavipes]|nr:hypothetical protein TNCV_4577111 [Trichonephila clavipes]